jgi:hypothetical protein
LRCLVVSIMYMVVMLKKKAISVVVGVGCSIILSVLIEINNDCTVPRTNAVTQKMKALFSICAVYKQPCVQHASN